MAATMEFTASLAPLKFLALTVCLAMALQLVSTVAASSGEATYYTVYTPSSCYGDDTSGFPAGNLIAAASPGLFNSKAACGQTYTITCTGNANGGANPCTSTPTVTVKVVDLCPGCPEPGFDLSQEAFSSIANTDAGKITITYNLHTRPPEPENEELDNSSRGGTGQSQEGA